MNLIAFDTSTDRMSLAVQHGATICTTDAPGGAQASATLVPLILDLMQQAGITFDTLDAIVFGRGPGSFTGLRTACAVAQGLATGARQGTSVPVIPIDTLVAVAEDAKQRTGCTQVVAVLDARMNEVYAAQLQWQPAAPNHTPSQSQPAQWVFDAPMTVSPPQNITVPAGYTLAGNAAAVYGADLAQGAPCIDAWPTAHALLRLATAQGSDLHIPASAALPLYIRDKVANTTAERLAQKMAAQTAA